MILLIDNQDSFTFNLFQAIEFLGYSCVVLKAQDAKPPLIRTFNPAGIILSPGPGHPEAHLGASALIAALAQTTPMLGVCLGHQLLGVSFGGSWGRSKEPTHGRATWIEHQGKRIFRGLKQPFQAARYHSLILNSTPDSFEPLAWSSSGELMAMGHKQLPLYGVQFHPESFMSPEGSRLLAHFCEECFDVG